MERFFGVGLLLLSLLMLYGFLRSDVDPSAPATVIALLIVVGLPALGGGALLWRQLGDPARNAQRRDALRRQTLQSEVLKLAGRHQGKLTVVEVMSEMALTPEVAKETLDGLMTAGLADIEVTESGVLVYAFGDVRHLSEKSQSKGILDD